MTDFLTRLKQKNEQCANVLIKVPVSEVMTYGAPTALLMQMIDNEIPVEKIPDTAYVFVRPEIIEDHHVFRIIWRKDFRPFSAGWIEKEVEPKIGTNGVPFHGFINGLYAMARPACEKKPEIYLGQSEVRNINDGPSAA